jgi:hypothetical protein
VTVLVLVCVALALGGLVVGLIGILVAADRNQAPKYQPPPAPPEQVTARRSRVHEGFDGYGQPVRLTDAVELAYRGPNAGAWTAQAPQLAIDETPGRTPAA